MTPTTALLTAPPDFNTYRLGERNFYDPCLTVDTNQPITVTTVFHTVDGTDDSALRTISRTYHQTGREIPQPLGAHPKIQPPSSNITNAFGAATAKHMDNAFPENTGMGAMGAAFEAGMVLVLSLWDQEVTHMQ